MTLFWLTIPYKCLEFELEWISDNQKLFGFQKKKSVFRQILHQNVSEIPNIIVRISVRNLLGLKTNHTKVPIFDTYCTGESVTLSISTITKPDEILK